MDLARHHGNASIGGTSDGAGGAARAVAAADAAIAVGARRGALWRLPAELTPRSLEVLRLLKPPVELLVVGTGRRLKPLPAAVEEWLGELAIAPEAVPTQHACSTFNFMVGEDRQVAAVLFPYGQ